MRSRNNALGRTSVLGTRTWNPQGRFDLILGPLSFAEFQKLLPGGLANRRLSALVHFYAGDCSKCIPICASPLQTYPQVASVAPAWGGPRG